MMGHRSIYHDGWRAVCPWPGTSFTGGGRVFGAPIEQGQADRAGCEGLGAVPPRPRTSRRTTTSPTENREKLIEMIATWYVEAGKYNVLPIDSRGVARIAEPRPQIAVERKSYTYYPGTQMVPANAGANVLNRPHSITADVEIPQGWRRRRAALGRRRPGRLLLLRAGRQAPLRLQLRRERVLPRRIERRRPGGPPQAALRVRSDRQARHRATARARRAARSSTSTASWSGRATLPLTMPLTIGLGGGIVCGADTGSPVWNKYKPPFTFTGTIHSVTVDVSGELIKDTKPRCAWRWRGSKQQ